MKKERNIEEILQEDEIEVLSVLKNDFDKEDDPCDRFDIFPEYLNNESKYYPKSWR